MKHTEGTYRIMMNGHMVSGANDFTNLSDAYSRLRVLQRICKHSTFQIAIATFEPINKATQG